MAARKKKTPPANDDGAFSRAVRAALDEADGEATKLYRVAQTLVTLAIDGNMTAIKEISDRLEGRPPARATAATAAKGEEGGPVEIVVTWQKE